ncbi:GNAT family N-acetyltransferase [Sphingomonas sp. ASV193]|uniref:GNAT family N-acetyltransferase n=1 Tax=Sphingomonas sp. ASV193 TaxID=3144405 RepID=UPI0032E866D7
MSSAPRDPGPGMAQAAVPIRDGTQHDLDAVDRIMRAAFDPRYGEGWTRSQCAGILPMMGVSMRLAGDPVAGFSLARTIADEAELLLIAVAPEAQRHGLGQSLLDDFVARAHAEGARRLHLEMRDNNPAIALYSASGFRPAGRRRDYYSGPSGERHDAITLVLEGRT